MTAVAAAWRSADGGSQLYRGDVFDLSPRLPGGAFDCIWTDPPYFLSNGAAACIAGRMVKADKGE